jgi:regulatory protein SWI5
MLSNPTNNLQNRQRQHRRQQSTPTAFDPVKVNNLPNIQKHAHRRGISLDQRRRTPPQDLMVSTTNNQGYQTTQQHILRETQQQRLARPGQNFNNYGNDENYLNSPTVTPNRQSFDAGQYGGQNPAQLSYPGQLNATINVDPSTFGSNDFNLYSADALTPSAYLDFSAGFAGFDGIQNSGENTRRTSGRRISGGIVDRVAQFENLALQSPHRPITPPNQNVASEYWLHEPDFVANIHRLLSSNTRRYPISPQAQA